MKATTTTASNALETQFAQQTKNMKSLKIFIFLTQMKIYCRMTDTNFDDFCDDAFGCGWKQEPMHTLMDLWNAKHLDYMPISSMDDFLERMLDNIDSYNINHDFL